MNQARYTFLILRLLEVRNQYLVKHPDCRC